MPLASDPYAVLGQSYAAGRRPDPRVAAHVNAALGNARSVVNVGAGTGSYEPTGLMVVAVEPSPVMVGQRGADAAPVLRAIAEHLPFADLTFDAALAVLTVHHWSSPAAGLAELRRVARRQVVLTWDQRVAARFWLVSDYLPEIAELERDLACMTVISRELSQAGTEVVVMPVPVPADCADGFLGAYWRRPEAYLDPSVRRCMSSIALLDPAIVDRACARLAADLASGRWRDRHGHLLGLDELDLGYRLVVALPGSALTLGARRGREPTTTPSSRSPGT
jgi:SAM-dependent methyltransferase